MRIFFKSTRRGSSHTGEVPYDEPVDYWTVQNNACWKFLKFATYLISRDPATAGVATYRSERNRFEGRCHLREREILFAADTLCRLVVRTLVAKDEHAKHRRCGTDVLFGLFSCAVGIAVRTAGVCTYRTMFTCVRSVLLYGRYFSAVGIFRQRLLLLSCQYCRTVTLLNCCYCCAVGTVAVGTSGYLRNGYCCYLVGTAVR